MQEIRFNVQEKTFKANLEFKIRKRKNQRNEAFIKVIDQRLILQDSHHKLAALQFELPCENAIYKTKKN